MLGRLAGTFVLAGVLFVGSAVPASAQIYTWRDANGRLVLSNTRPSAETPATTYAVPKAEEVRATRAVATRRWSAYEDLITEHSRAHGVRAGAARTRPQSRISGLPE